MTEKVNQTTHHDCLGKVNKRYCRYCSEDCPWVSVCVLIVMGVYLLQDHIVLESADSL